MGDRGCVVVFVRLREGLCCRFGEGSRRWGEGARTRVEVIMGVVVSNCASTIWSIDWVVSAVGVVTIES